MNPDQIAPKPKRILVPVDLSPRSELAVGYGAMLAGLCSADLLLLMNVNATGQNTFHDFAAEEGLSLGEAADKSLRRITKQLPAELSVATKVTFAEYPEDGILEAVQTEAVDLIVLASHGRAGMGRWIFGSVAESITRGGDVPVVVLPADE
jgi:nucleotide-binding universal stress UspA family protein